MCRKSACPPAPGDGEAVMNRTKRGQLVRLQEVIEELSYVHGSLRAAARVLKIDPAYLLRLRDGSKVNPSAIVLRRLGVRKEIIYRRVMEG
jgi:hypothetical protein